ncbi:hypothetical protein [Amycolatopsis rubida]|uniref:Collagen triple helix repeat-containing protein n=1 Tax=Amycolatopsis rubida TaxID=112413 RepID=A0A1I5IG18_9PSEU|nr:hypothetical protein [Amycolatopsis rubida]SFO59493.1 hypothetical protein SAMN05421854_102450 [Amycolatopsis rubida]
MTGEIDRTIVQPAADKSRDRRAHRLLWLGALLALGGVAWLAVQLFGQGSEIASLQRTSDARGADVSRLAEQVKGLGGTPVVQPPAAPTPAPAAVDATTLRQTARQAVEDYCATRNQCRGTDGASPDFDALTNAVLAKIPVPKDGTDGQNGQNGRDAPLPDYPALVASAVASYCDAHDQCRGEQGTPGVNGANGKDGPACPDGFELRDAVITSPDGTTYQGKACVDPNSGSTPPSTDPPPTTGG